MKTRLFTTFAVALMMMTGCSDDTSSGMANSGSGSNAGTTNNGSLDMTSSNTDGGGTGNLDGGSGFDLADVPFEQNEQGMVICKDGEPCECSDGIDNDGNGLRDGFDPECTGPYDDDESSFATGIPGDNKDPKQDCFFDGNSGSGNDGCSYDIKCLTGELPQDDPACTLSDRCIEFCAKYTPNGCDCFGCCEVRDEQGTIFNVVIGTECSIETLDDASKCQTCTPSTQCGNTCGECELCLGKTIEDLPASCSMMSTPDMGDMGPGSDMDTTGDMGGTNPGPGYVCDGGRQLCDVSSDCDNGTDTAWYCLQGCCFEIEG